MAARYANDIEIAKAQRDYELKKSTYDQEVHTKKAQSDMAYELQVQTIDYHIHIYNLMKTNTTPNMTIKYVISIS